MLQTFDSSVPLPEQRLRVALKKSTRNHPKRHSTAPERVKKAKKAAGARKYALGALAAAIKRKKDKARAFWRGEWLNP